VWPVTAGLFPGYFADRYISETYWAALVARVALPEEELLAFGALSPLWQ
jgi:hypothetical protein